MQGRAVPPSTPIELINLGTREGSLGASVFAVDAGATVVVPGGARSGRSSRDEHLAAARERAHALVPKLSMV